MKLWDPPSEVRENPGRVADSHTSLKFEAELIGGHVHVKVRAATRHPSVQVDHSRGLCGTLVMAPAEWLLFRLALEGAPTPGLTWVLTEENTARILCGAGHPDIADIEVEHVDGTQRFIQIEEAP